MTDVISSCDNINRTNKYKCRMSENKYRMIRRYKTNRIRKNMIEPQLEYNPMQTTFE